MPLLILFLLLAFAPSAHADFAQGYAAYQRGDGKAALVHLLPLAQQGNDEAQYYLGRLYYYPIRGIRKDYRQSAKWFRLAAEQGHAAARYKIGGMYLSGRGLPPDDQQAVRWWLLAAEQGHHESQNNLGAMFANGRGVPQNMVAAYALQSLALAGGNELAAENLRSKEGLMSPAEIDEARRLAESLKQPANFNAALRPYLGASFVGLSSDQPR